MTTFFDTCRSGDIDRVKVLVSQGADVRANNHYAVQLTSYYGHLEVLMYLVSQGANVRANNHYAVQWASRMVILKLSSILCLKE